MATTAPSPSSRDVQVTITIDPSGAIQVSPDPFWISKSKKEEVKWDCSDPFTVQFNKDGSPFDSLDFGTDRPHSGPARPDVQPGPRIYHYTVKVRGKSLDPGGGVDQ